VFATDAWMRRAMLGDPSPWDPEGPGWPEPRAFPVRECLSVILNEEWEHRLYAERDLDTLESRRRSL
jgi:hypothetical protein